MGNNKSPKLYMEQAESVYVKYSMHDDFAVLGTWLTDLKSRFVLFWYFAAHFRTIILRFPFTKRYKNDVLDTIQTFVTLLKYVLHQLAQFKL